MSLPEVGPGAKVTAGSTARPVRVAAKVDPAYDARRQKITVLTLPLHPVMLAKVGFGNVSALCIRCHLR